MFELNLRLLCLKDNAIDETNPKVKNFKMLKSCVFLCACFKIFKICFKIQKNIFLFELAVLSYLLFANVGELLMSLSLTSMEHLI